jgi:hypothetical protein
MRIPENESCSNGYYYKELSQSSRTKINEIGIKQIILMHEAIDLSKIVSLESPDFVKKLSISLNSAKVPVFETEDEGQYEENLDFAFNAFAYGCISIDLNRGSTGCACRCGRRTRGG